MEVRFERYGRKLFSKDNDEANTTTATQPQPTAGVEHILEDGTVATPLQDFEIRLNNLRLTIHDMGYPRIMEVFNVRLRAVEHAFGELNNLEEFLLEYRTGPYNNEKRKLVDIVCNKIWGRECFGTIEKFVMDKLKLKYENWLAETGKPPSTRRSHGSVKSMHCRMKQTLICERIR